MLSEYMFSHLSPENTIAALSLGLYKDWGWWSHRLCLRTWSTAGRHQRRYPFAQANPHTCVHVCTHTKYKLFFKEKNTGVVKEGALSGWAGIPGRGSLKRPHVLWGSEPALPGHPPFQVSSCSQGWVLESSEARVYPTRAHRSSGKKKKGQWRSCGLF